MLILVMRIDWQEIIVNQETIMAKVTIQEKDDQEYLKRIYFDWLNLNKEIYEKRV
jgi:hypothetical protein